MRVPITGIGVVASEAIGVDAFRRLLESGRTAIADVERFDTSGFRSHRAALIREFKARDFIAPTKLRRMNTLSRHAVSAARLALDDAGGGPQQPGQTGVALGTCFGPVQTSVEYMKEYVEKGAALAPPQLFAESVANAPGSHIAIEHGFRGFNVTVTQRESSALAAAMYGASQIVKGAAGAALLGGVEEINEMVFSVLDRIGALAHAAGDVGEASRPFDRRRNGLIVGEGSAVIVAERPETEREAYGFLAGFGMARDVTARVSDWGSDPAPIVSAMRRAIDDAEIDAGAIDAVFASANSTVRADGVERRAIEMLFGDRLPPVVATKGTFGEYAAGGALHLAAALLAVDAQALFASAGFEEPEADARIEVVRETRPATLRNVLVNSISAGGGIVCAVISKTAA